LNAVPFVQAFAEHAPAVLPSLPGAGLSWLDAARRVGLADFERDGLPGARDEAWKYTALRGLAQRRYAAVDSDAATRAVDAAALAWPGLDGPRLVFVNGVFRADLSALDALPAGLDLLPLSRALRDDPEPLRFALTRRAMRRDDAFTRLNTALAGDGVVLRVAAGVHIETPVRIAHLGAAAVADVAWHVRNLVDVGVGARLSLVEHFVHDGALAQFGTVASDVMLREGSRLDWLLLQDATKEATLVRHNALRLDARAEARVHALELGGALVRHGLDADLVGEGACLVTRGAFLPRGRQHIDTHLDIRHAAKNTTSDALWRGVADQRGRGVFRGAITVEAGADGTDATLNNKNLLLSAQSEIDTQPVLEIHADEVRAAHGATVGQLDERALFYLRSRGMPLDAARALLTTAFCRAAFDSMTDGALRRLVDEKLTAG
jgi:Fe-S cluster assembly protein SufD